MITVSGARPSTTRPKACIAPCRTLVTADQWDERKHVERGVVEAPCGQPVAVKMTMRRRADHEEATTTPSFARRRMPRTAPQELLSLYAVISRTSNGSESEHGWH